MSDTMLVRHCSPTLAGVKSGSLFTCAYHSKESVREWIRLHNRRLRQKGLRIVPLRFSEKRVLIYVYRPERLRRDLGQSRARQLLQQEGYPAAAPETCVAHLKNRLKRQQEFPHEIGLFLGYPPEDVWGFILQGPHCSKCCGCWRVYDDEEKAKKLFAQYKKCTDVYCRRLREGSSLERLTVAC